MPIITFSSDTFEKSSEIAARTAEALGYRYVDRRILTQVAAKYNLSEAKLIRALDETPSFMGMSSKSWRQYLAYIQEAVLGELLSDNVVCRGLAAHLYVLGVAHVLKIGILVDPEQRARDIATQEGVSPDKAGKIVRNQEKQRKRWSIDAFGVDATDPSLYDMLINISQIDPEEAVGMITAATGYRKFQPMTYSIQCLQDRDLAGRVEAALIGEFPEVRVQARSGIVVVEIKAVKREKQKKTMAIKERVQKISGVQFVEVHIINDIFRQAAESGR
jgi:cytidylate kinase